MKPKLKCPKCNKVYRTKHFVKNNLLNTTICKFCDKRVGHNKFYVPFEKRTNRDFVGKANLSMAERMVLYKQYLSIGFSPSKASWKVNSFCAYLRRVFYSRKRWARINELKAKKQKEQAKQDKQKSMKELGQAK